MEALNDADKNGLRNANCGFQKRPRSGFRPLRFPKLGLQPAGGRQKRGRRGYAARGAVGLWQGGHGPARAEACGAGGAGPGSPWLRPLRARLPPQLRRSPAGLPAAANPSRPARALPTHPDSKELILQPSARSGWARRAAGAKRGPARPPPSACSGPDPVAPRLGRAIFAARGLTRRTLAFLPALGPPPSSLLPPPSSFAKPGRRIPISAAAAATADSRQEGRGRRGCGVLGEGRASRALHGARALGGRPPAPRAPDPGRRPRPTPPRPAPPWTRKEPSARRKRPKGSRSPASRCRRVGPAAGKGAPSCWWCGRVESSPPSGPAGPSPHARRRGRAHAMERGGGECGRGCGALRPSAPGMPALVGSFAWTPPPADTHTAVNASQLA
nr:translation initiation factor IF-2-like [Chlorocebus sabaeus]